MQTIIRMTIIVKTVAPTTDPAIIATILLSSPSLPIAMLKNSI